MSMIMKPEEMAFCPYDKAHVVRKERMQFHLVKCGHANKYKKLKVLTCPFNNTHKVPAWELNHHMTECEDRGKVETFAISTEESSPLFAIVPVTVQSSETWDNVPPQTYKPSDVIYEKPVLLNLQGVTPSERKAFRAEERRRLKEYQVPQTKTTDTGIVGYVRRPKGKPKAKETTAATLMQDFQNLCVSGAPQDSSSGNTVDKSLFEDKEGFVVPRYSRRGRSGR